MAEEDNSLFFEFISSQESSGIGTEKGGSVTLLHVIIRNAHSLGASTPAFAKTRDARASQRIRSLPPHGGSLLENDRIFSKSSKFLVVLNGN